MVKYPQMKIAAIVLFVFLSFSALAAVRVVVSSMPEPMRPLAEVETNVAFSAGAPGDNLWRLSVELDASVSNSVEVVLGADVDEDGVLGIEEGELCVGWDCGEWFFRDRRGGGVQYAADAVGARRLEWTLRLNADKSARSVDGNVFSGSIAPTCFNPAWVIVRVVTRGAGDISVESRVTVDALSLRIR